MASVAFLAYNRADTSIVSFFSNQHAAGIYAPASSAQNALMVIPGALTAAVATVGARYAREGGAALDQLKIELWKIARLAFGLSVGLSALMTLFAPIFVRLFVGHQYGATVLPLRILCWSLPFNAVEFALLGLLTAAGKPRATVWFFVTSFVVALSAHAVLTPRYGATGGAAASLLREPVGLAVLVWVVRRNVFSVSRAER
jgi:O-antigen/teichoic acid export membrane protein